MQAVLEIPSRRAASSGSKSRTTRSAMTSLSAADSSPDAPLERRGEPVGEAGLADVELLLNRVGVLAPAPPVLGAEVVERDGARDRAEPGVRARPPRIEPRPGAERLLEGDARQLLRELAVTREVGEVAVDVGEMPLGGLREVGSSLISPDLRRRPRHRSHGGADAVRTPDHGRSGRARRRAAGPAAAPARRDARLRRQLDSLEDVRLVDLELDGVPEAGPASPAGGSPGRASRGRGSARPRRCPARDPREARASTACAPRRYPERRCPRRPPRGLGTPPGRPATPSSPRSVDPRHR